MIAASALPKPACHFMGWVAHKKSMEGGDDIRKITQIEVAILPTITKHIIKK